MVKNSKYNVICEWPPDLVIFEPMSFIADEKVDVEILHEVCWSDEHLVTHDQDWMAGIFHVFSNLGTLLNITFS